MRGCRAKTRKGRGAKTRRIEVVQEKQVEEQNRKSRALRAKSIKRRKAAGSKQEETIFI